MIKAIHHEAQQRLVDELAAWKLPPECVTELIDHSHCVSYAPGASIFLKGSSADVIFWVLSGLAKVSYPNANGSRVVVKLAGPGDIIGFAAIGGPGGHHTQAFECDAVTKSAVALFTRDHVMRALQRLAPQRLISLIELLNSSWSSTYAYYARFLGLSFKERLELIFRQLADRFGVKDSRGILLTHELSHEALAEMIASSRPMVSRLIAEMLDQNVLARQGKHYIVLEALAAQPHKNGVRDVRTATILRQTSPSPNTISNTVSNSWSAPH